MNQQTIGSASMKQDGTLILDLRAEGPNNEIGMARLVYPTTHPRYQKILAHLGGMKPGEQKAVPPFPDERQ